jgi:hypothetical protein
MDKIDQFFQQLKERFSNPLFFSFLLSWVFFNWRVTVALVWYDPPKYSNGYISLIDFISKSTNSADSFWYPMTFALIYTFAGPVVGNIVSAFKSWNSKWGEEWNLKILKGSKIPIDKYFSLRKEYHKRTEDLEGIISQESATLEQLQAAQTELLQTKHSLNQTSSKLAEAQSIINGLNDLSFLQGKWIKRFKEPGSNNEIKENIEILSGIVSYYEGINRNEKYTIQNFTYNKQSGTVTFSFFRYNSNPKDTSFISGFHSFNDLRLQHDELVGREYRAGVQNEVRYSRS